MPASCFSSRQFSRTLAGAADIREGEGRPILACGLLFFLVLAVVMVLRPVREATGLGITGPAVAVLPIVLLWITLSFLLGVAQSRRKFV